MHSPLPLQRECHGRNDAIGERYKQEQRLFVSMGFLQALSRQIRGTAKVFDQAQLQSFIAPLYSPEHLAAMVTERYPITPYVRDYKEVIAEAVEAHFMGLGHVAVAGLMPVIEGVGKQIAESRGLVFRAAKSGFVKLANDCKDDAAKNNIGAVGEIVSMMDSFIYFVERYLYIDSTDYDLEDRTNRHGILHGRYSDKDYGEPINFYKSLAAVDFLCFIAAFRAYISFFAPDPTEASRKLEHYYGGCIALAKGRPK